MRAWHPVSTGRFVALPLFESRNGVATSSLPGNMALKGNEDVAAPIDAGAVSRFARIR